jgi:hypothetical protein
MSAVGRSFPRAARVALHAYRYAQEPQVAQTVTPRLHRGRPEAGA